MSGLSQSAITTKCEVSGRLNLLIPYFWLLTPDSWLLTTDSWSLAKCNFFYARNILGWKRLPLTDMDKDNFGSILACVKSCLCPCLLGVTIFSLKYCLCKRNYILQGFRSLESRVRSQELGVKSRESGDSAFLTLHTLLLLQIEITQSPDS